MCIPSLCFPVVLDQVGLKLHDGRVLQSVGDNVKESLELQRQAAGVSCIMPAVSGASGDPPSVPPNPSTSTRPFSTPGPLACTQTLNLLKRVPIGSSALRHGLSEFQLQKVGCFDPRATLSDGSG